MSTRRIFDNRRNTVSVEILSRNKAVRTTTRCGARRGFTLIEVMVALAIFVIGALAIVRIFPPALGVIQGSESRSIAMGRSRGYLARTTAQPGLVPDAIYEVANDDASTTNDFVGAPSGTASRNKALPISADESAIQDSALGRFKRIIGEKHRVLTDTPTPPSIINPSQFVLSQFAHTAIAPTNDVKIYVEDRVSGVAIDNRGDVDFTNAKLVTDGRDFNDLDYKTHKSDTMGSTDQDMPPSRQRAPVEWRRRFPSGEPQTIYYVSYRYVEDANNNTVIDASERIRSVVDEPLVLPAPLGNMNAIRVLAGRTQAPRHLIIPGEVGMRVKRLLRTVGTGPVAGVTTKGSAYTGAVTSANRAAVEADSIRGYVALTDADNLTEDIPVDLREAAAITAPLVYKEVSLDYTVRDWRWLVDDDTPERDLTNADRDGTIRTAIRYYDSTALGNLSAPNALDPVNQVRPVFGALIRTNFNTGKPELFKDGYWEQGAGAGGVIRDISKEDRKNGVIHYVPLAITTADPLRRDTRRARTSYWTFDGWAQQVSVAARSYTPSYMGATFDPAYPRILPAGTLPAERDAWREYYWAGVGATNLYFPPSEAGKSVLVKFEYEKPSGTYYTRTSILTIDDDIVTSPVIGFGAFQNPAPNVTSEWKAAVAQFVDPAIKPGPGYYNVRAILSVQGLTVQSRTAWIDNGRYSQTDAVGYRSLENS